MGLNRGNQLVIIDLPEPLHSGSSVTTDEHPHLQIDTPLPTAEEPEHTTLPLGGMPATPADTIPKTPWKARITLMAEVDDLLNRGMVDDYNCKSEHSPSGKEIATEADIPPPHKVEVLAPPLDTSSQASVEEVDTSMESNPINIYPTTDAGSSRSNSPMVDFMELQEDANLAANYMLTVKGLQTSKNNGQFEISGHRCASRRLKKLLPMREPKLSIPGRTSMPRWDAPKEVMAAKFNYRMDIQEARMTRCNWLQESETEYSEAVRENAAARSTQSAILHREHVEYMHQLEEQALSEETKSCCNFLSACQAILCHAPQPLKDNLSTSYHILLGRLPKSL